MRFALVCLVTSAVLASPNRAQAPVYAIVRNESSIKFSVKASVPLEGTFDKWNATLRFASPDLSTGSLYIKILAASVDTGSGIKNGKLKGKDFFNARQDSWITFQSKKAVQTGPNAVDVQGDFTIRGISRPETLTVTVSGVGTGSGTIKGTMAFDRKDYGMNSGIPFIRIADRVEVNVDLKVKRLSGPPVLLKQ
jgi:polyisoprenoid-binding protein YceI